MSTELDDIKIYLLAAKAGNLPVIKAQIENGVVDINQQGCDGRSALHYATIGKHWHVMDYLIKNFINKFVEDAHGKLFTDYLIDDETTI
jgi:ankyrin repeat protein